MGTERQTMEPSGYFSAICKCENTSFRISYTSMDSIGRVDWKRFERFLFRIGCEFKGQTGSHRKCKKAGLLRPVIVPCDDDLPDFIIQNNLRTLGVPKKVYLEMIKRL